MTYPLASSSWDEREIAAMQEVIASGHFTMGRHVAEAEKQFADHFGSRYAVMTSSGSTANLLMVAACFFTATPLLERGDEVIVPAVSWSTTYFPLQQYGLHVRFVDVDPHTLNMDLGQLEAAVTDRTRAILAVNLLGNPNDFAAIRRITAGRDVLLLEDNCESMGATFQGRAAGTFGAMGTFSSFFSHHISTMEGGFVVTDSEELYHVLLVLRAHGWTRNLPKENLVTGTKSDDPFEESFKFVLPGYNVRPLELSGAIGKVQLEKLPEFVRVRRENAAIFKELFADVPSIRTQRETGESSWFGFSMVIEPDAPYTRQQLVDALVANGIEARPVVTGNFLKNDRVLRFFDYSAPADGVPNAEHVDAHGLFVGNHHIPLSPQLHQASQVVRALEVAR